MAKRKRKLKLKFNFKAIGIGALALLLAGGLIYGQRSLQQKTQVEEQAAGFGPRCQDRATKQECTAAPICMDASTSCRWSTALEQCQKQGDSSCGGGTNPSSSPNPSGGGTLPLCYKDTGNQCGRSSVKGVIKCLDKVLYDNAISYCCPKGQMVRSGKCVSIPTCESGLKCNTKGGYWEGSFLCKTAFKPNGQYCCPAGTKLQGYTCKVIYLN